MSTHRPAGSWRRARTAAGRVVLLAVAAIGFVFVRYAFIILRDFGWKVWPLSLLLCALAVGCWSLTAAFWRTTRVSDSPPRVERADPAGTP